MPPKLKTGFLPICLALAVTLALVEVSFRVYNYFYPTSIFYTGHYDRFRGRPLAGDWGFKLNSLGFKDLEFGKKEKGTYRIAALGDSFAFGVVPYRFNYLTLAESMLNRSGLKAQVLNMGIPDTGPQDYLALLIAEGLALEPDMVLVGFYIGNDFKTRRPKIYEYSYLGSFINYLLNIRPKFKGRVYHQANEYCDQCPTFAGEVYAQMAFENSRIFVMAPEEFQDRLHAALDPLLEIKRICAQRGIELKVILIPSEEQVNPSLHQRVVKMHPPSQEASWDLTRPNRMLSSELTKAGIAHLDLYELFAAKTMTGTRFYKLNDSHWNTAGNQLAAETVARFIRD